MIKDVILCFRHGSPAYYADCWAPIYTGLHQLPTYRDDPLPSKLRPEGNTEAADQQPLLGRRGEYIHSRLLICVYIKWFIQFSSIQFYSHNPKSQQQSHQGNPTVVQRKSHLEINVIENDKRFFLIFHQVKALLSTGINQPRKGTDAGDHPPITPMCAATEAELGEQYRQITEQYHLFLWYTSIYIGHAFKEQWAIL